jgi:hypothetical protein
VQNHATGTGTTVKVKNHGGIGSRGKDKRLDHAVVGVH